MGEAKKHPWIRPTDFVKALDQQNRLDLLLPADDWESSKLILREYWERFTLQFGNDHGVFDSVSQPDLALTIPCRWHGDEGRSKLNLLILFSNFLSLFFGVCCFLLGLKLLLG